MEEPDQSPTSKHVPKVDIFKSEDSAYDFYNKYAKIIRFSVKKCHLKRRADKSV
jgi:hypothetical protein